MAFNPFSNFWKYKRAWMAGILLLTMFTFVLCTGQAGDLSDRIQNWLRGRGETIFTIAGTRYTSQDLEELKLHRKIANDFMKQTFNLTTESLRKELEVPPKGADKEKEKEDRQKLTQIYSQLSFAGKKSFFGNTNSLDSAIDYLLWLAEADRLRVDLDDRDVDMLWRYYTAQFGEMGRQMPKIQVVYMVQNNVGGRQATEKIINKALKDEFRVWIAKRALLREAVGERPTQDVNVVYDQGLDEVDDFFKKKRSSVDIELIPIHLADLAKKMPTPTKQEVQKAFDEFHKNTFQPDSEKWSLVSPQQATFKILTADPNAERFHTTAQVTTALDGYPITALSPLAPFTSVLRLAAGAPVTDEAALELLKTNRLRVALQPYSTVGLGNFNYRWPISNYYSSRSEPAVAAYAGVAGASPLGALGSLWAHAPKDVLTKADRQKLIDESIQSEAKRRIPVVATLLGLGSTSRSALMNPAILDGLEQEFQLLPMTVIRPDLRDRLVKEETRRLAGKMMLTLRNFLQTKYIKQGVFDADKLDLVLDEFYKQNGRDWLKVEETAKYYSKLDVQDAPELKPLYEQFERMLPNYNFYNERVFGGKKIDPDQFYKLFFENNDAFCANQNYRVCYWPPKLTRDKSNPAHQLMAQNMPEEIDLFTDSENPIIYWRTETREPTSPKALDFAKEDDTLNKTITLAKMLKARDNDGIKLARSIAEELIRSRNEYWLQATALPDEKKGTRDPIRLPHVAQWEKRERPVGQGAFVVDYVNYSVPPKVIPYARTDMASQLLSLNDTDKAFTVGQDALDAANKELFELSRSTYGGKNGKVIQILTNRPRDIYYVAFVERTHPATQLEFDLALAHAADRNQLNLFLHKYRQDFAKGFNERFIEQLKRDHKYKEVDRKRGEDMFKNEVNETADGLDEF